jgi:hypothetical protein
MNVTITRPRGKYLSHTEIEIFTGMFYMDDIYIGNNGQDFELSWNNVYGFYDTTEIALPLRKRNKSLLILNYIAK